MAVAYRIPAVVYVIKNTVTGHCYVGSTVSPRARWQQHQGELRRGTHHSASLQKAWLEYGEDVFIVDVLELVIGDSAALLAAEQRWIDALKPYGVGGYNCSQFADASMRGRLHTAETRAKMRAAWASETHKKKPPMSAETRAKISARRKGTKLTEEHREKIGAAHRGMKRSEEARRNISAALKGKPKNDNQRGLKRTAESRARMAEAQQRRRARDRAATAQQPMGTGA